MCERVGGWGAGGEGVAVAGGLMMQFSGSGVTKQHKAEITQTRLVEQLSTERPWLRTAL